MRIRLFPFGLAICLGVLSRAEAWQVPPPRYRRSSTQGFGGRRSEVRSVRNAQDWLNPYILLQKNGVVLINRANRGQNAHIH